MFRLEISFRFLCFKKSVGPKGVGGNNILFSSLFLRRSHLIGPPPILFEHGALPNIEV